MHVTIRSQSRAYGGGFLGFQETPFDSKAISKITSLSKFMIINILASYAYQSAIQYSTFQKLLRKQVSYCESH